MSPEFFVGCDPDTKHSAYAVVNRAGKIHSIFTVESDATEFNSVLKHKASLDIMKVIGDFRAVLESQVVYKGVKSSNPKDLIRLARSSGISASYMGNSSFCTGIEMVTPFEWKGTKKKHAHQADILWKMGIEHKTLGTGDNRYTVPTTNLYGLTPTRWKHAVDALGLALWLRDKVLWEEKKQKALSDL